MMLLALLENPFISPTQPSRVISGTEATHRAFRLSLCTSTSTSSDTLSDQKKIYADARERRKTLSLYLFISYNTSVVKGKEEHTHRSSCNFLFVMKKERKDQSTY
jgi:hypothetical protein